MSKKKVLVVSYYFPPLGMAGVQRVAKFVKYIPAFGWEPVVLTVKEIEYFAKDPSLVDDIPRDIKVFKTGSFDPLRALFLLKKIFRVKNDKDKKTSYKKERLNLSSWIFSPDSKIGWLPFALAKGLSIMKKEKMDLIFSSSPPPTAHLIAYYLKTLTNKKWVADFRDMWLGYGFKECPTFFHGFLKDMIQGIIFRNADRFITINERIAERIKKKAGYTAGLDIISNGYDKDDFSFQTDKKDDLFEITYCGALSPDSDPEPFFVALSNLINEEKDLSSKIRFVHIGNSFGIDLDGLIEKYRLKKIIQRPGYLSHKEAIKKMSGSDLLLLLVSEGKDRDEISTSKIFEYLYAKKPILAVAPPCGAAGELVKRFKRGRVISPENVNEIKTGIKYFFERKEKLSLIDEKDLKIFDRENLAKRLVQVFDSLIS